MTNKLRCYVIGNPVEHSLSPKMQNAAFRDLRINAIYSALKIEREKLKQKVENLRNPNTIGFNVTLPYKIEIIKFLDQIDKTAKAIGAVNTVVNSNGKLKGFNTDGYGALEALKETINPRNKIVTIIGAGGAARAIAFTLVKEGHVRKIYILNRTKKKATDLSSISTKIIGNALNYTNLEECIKDSDVLINCIPVTMHKQSPVPKNLLHTGLVVFDIVYNPMETRLLKDAKSVGCRTVSGYKMLIYQGAKSFELFTGEKPNIEVMKRIVLEILSK